LIEELTSLDFSVGPVRGQAWAMNHPGIAVGYRLWTSGGSIAYLPDNEPFSSRQDGSGGSATKNSRLADFIRGADVLIIDTQYDCDEYQSHIGWGHGCVDDVVELAVAADVKRLFLFHHDPDHDDEKVASMLAHARELVRASNSPMRTDAAREGEECVLKNGASAVSK